MKTIGILMGILLATTVSAEELTLKVNGMVCAFCAQGIQKKFTENKAVESVKVDLENKQVLLQTKAGQNLSDDELKKAITDSGYALVAIERKSEKKGKK